MANKLKIIGLTISISFIMFISLALFVKSIGILFDTWFSNNALIIAIVSGIVVLIGIITGSISISAMTSKGKGIFS